MMPPAGREVLRRPSRWRPLLDGSLAHEARAAVDEIAALLDSSTAGLGRLTDAGASLAGGCAGVAVFHAYLRGEHALETDSVPAGRACLLHAIALLEDAPLQPGLFSGVAGVAWALAHLEHRLEMECADDAFEIIDLLVENAVEHARPGEFDLVSGLVGLGVYALERLSGDVGRRMLERIVSRLEEMAEHRETGTTWLTPPELLVPRQRDLAPRGYYNLGFAHGVAGVIAFLGSAYAAGVAPGRCLALLDGSVRWLLKQEPAGVEAPAFPFWIAPEVERFGVTRQAWCYGDLGIAVGLLRAARAVGNREWETKALCLAARAASCSPERCGVVDAGLCHGAAGLAHLFNRIYQATGLQSMHEAARAWFSRTLDLRRPGEGLAGFLAYQPSDAGTAWIADPGLLTGVAGIGLALHAALVAEEPAWDRFLLLSGLPPEHEACDQGDIP